MPENQHFMKVKLIVFDIAGTTVQDKDEVLICFSQACRQSGIITTDARLNALMGVSKLEVFQLLWHEQLGFDAPDYLIESKAAFSFETFRAILEKYYHENPVLPTIGALEIFEWARQNGIHIALNTGFYRKVTDIILGKLGWLPGQENCPVDFVIASDQVPAGRPEPYMIQAAMAHFGITDSKQVVKIGDTPVDLLEGRKAGCALSLALTNGTHTEAELAVLDNDGLLPSLVALPQFLMMNDE